MHRLTGRKLLVCSAALGGATSMAVMAAPALAAPAMAAQVSHEAASALAATSWRITPGGTVKAVASKPLFEDAKTHFRLTCRSAAAKGKLKSGTGPGVGSVTALSFQRCVGPLGVTFSLKAMHLPWTLKLISFHQGVTTAVITGVHVRVSTISCLAAIDGTAANADNGTMKVTYSNSTGRLKILATGGNLHAYNSRCEGFVNSHDPVAIGVGTYTVTPRQTIMPASSAGTRRNGLGRPGAGS